VATERVARAVPATVRCEHCGTPATANADDEVRCVCGSLLARKVPGGYELKCRRCKRAVVVSDSDSAD
jgi:DNA-directed RNA polymerase subunit RPC12/RpoP